MTLVSQMARYHGFAVEAVREYGDGCLTKFLRETTLIYLGPGRSPGCGRSYGMQNGDIYKWPIFILRPERLQH